MSATKEKRFVATGHVMVGFTRGQSVRLAPGEHVVFNEDLPSHQTIKREIASGANDRLELVEVDLDEEQARKQAQQDLEAQLAAEAEEARQRDLEASRVAAGEGTFNPEEHNVADVLDYLRQASPDEVERVKTLEAASDRASKQVADFELKE